MTNERSNSDWINKLDELERIEETAFNKETSWNKLYERLYLKSGKRKTIWYWLATACLFFVLFISLFMPHKRESVIAKNNLQPNKNNSPLVQHMPIVNKDRSSVVSSLSVKKKSVSHSTNEIDHRNNSVQNKLLTNEIVMNKKEKEIIPELANSTFIPEATVNNLAANLPGKKKLKVVHINELGDPVAESPNVARNNEQHSFQFKFMNQEVYTRQSPAIIKSGFTIFTSKSLTTN
jgi:hypothetical protein